MILPRPAALLDAAVNLGLRALPPEPRRRLSFAYRYRRGQTPWDTNTTPPEVLEFLDDPATTPGRALDLGCGTATNVATLAARGWQVTGVDYVERAIERGRARLAAAGLEATLLAGDVTHLEALPLDPPYDYVLDIGCLHSLTAEGRRRYAAGLARLVRPNALFMLYGGLPRQSNTGIIGISPDEVATLFAPTFAVERQSLGEDSGGGWARGWYWLRARGDVV